jgi:lipoprotein-anchoring transpeptidase ErfK/SrfK
MRRILASTFAAFPVAASALVLIVADARADSQLLDPGWQIASSENQSRTGGGFFGFFFGDEARQNTVTRVYPPAPTSYQRAPEGQPRADQPAPQYVPPRGLLQLFVRSDPAPVYAPPALGDMAHPVVDSMYDRQVVDYHGAEKPGTIIIDTPNFFLYLVLEDGKALRYGIGVGRQGFTWSGVKQVSAMREWPDWYPPDEMLQRRPDLPRFMPGGPDNPLGARALYLGSTLYRIHGSNEPWTIGHQVSSGCIRLRNADVIDLYGRVKVGAKVVVI